MEEESKKDLKRTLTILFIVIGIAVLGIVVSMQDSGITAATVSSSGFSGGFSWFTAIAAIAVAIIIIIAAVFLVKLNR